MQKSVKKRNYNYFNVSTLYVLVVRTLIEVYELKATVVSFLFGVLYCLHIFLFRLLQLFHVKKNHQFLLLVTKTLQKDS